MWEFLRMLFRSSKFKLFIAAAVVWGASFAGLDIPPASVEVVLAIIAGWLGVAGALGDARERELKSQLVDVHAHPVPLSVAPAMSTKQCAACAQTVRTWAGDRPRER